MAATDQKAAVVPGIPLSALDAIKDENVRDVLRALVDAHHVRNGDVGSAGERFVTANEVGLAPGRTAGMAGGYGNVQSNAGAAGGIKPSEVGRIINQLQAQIIESPLFKELGERINLIDLPGGIISQLGAGLYQELQNRVSSDNVLAAVINTLWGAIGNNQAIVQTGSSITMNQVGAVAANWNQVQVAIRGPNGPGGVPGPIISSSAIKQAFEASVSATGSVGGKYSLKIDVNGYVSGFGLINSANNSTPYSEFIVRADTFAIGSPSVPRVQNPDGTWQPGPTANIPFIVTTTPRTVNGIYSPPGVYIQNAFIENGTIATAQIGVAQIETLTVAGNAITVPSSAFSNSLTDALPASVWTTVLEINVDFGSVAPVMAVLTGSINFLAQTSGTSSTISCRFLQNDFAGDMSFGLTASGGFSTSASFSDRFTPTTGIHNYKLQVNQSVGSTVYFCGARNIVVIGSKR